MNYNCDKEFHYWTRFFYNIAKSYGASAEIEDFEQEARLVMYQAENQYSEEKSSKRTFISNVLRTKLGSFTRKLTNNCKNVNQDDIDVDEFMASSDIFHSVSINMEKLSDFEKKVLLEIVKPSMAVLIYMEEDVEKAKAANKRRHKDSCELNAIANVLSVSLEDVKAVIKSVQDKIKEDK